MFPRGNRPITGQGGLESGSIVAADVILDPELVRVIEAWASLPPNIRTAILAIVETTQGR